MENRHKLLEVKNIVKIFTSRNTENLVLDDISFNVDKGEFVSLLGPSGCGKTTMLSIIAGFRKMDAGKILLDGKTVTKAGPDRAYVFQNYALFPWKTVKENILFPMKESRMSKSEMEERFDYLMDISELKGHENKYPHEISGGMKQRTALARAIAVTPKVLLMDEPLGALDVQMKKSLQGEIERICLKENPTVIMVTHDVDESVFLSDRVIIMSRGGGHIEAQVHVDLARPRNRDTPEFKEYSAHIAGILNSTKKEEATGEIEYSGEVISEEYGI